jgi:glycerol-3-phosphate acyltransferase PlsY
VIGHNFPVWLKLKGGKGIATTGGGLLWLMPMAFAVAFSVWAIVFLISCYVSLGSVASAIALPIATWFFYPKELALICFSCFLSVMAIWRHRSNIQRLLNGTESRWTRKPSVNSPQTIDDGKEKILDGPNGGRD